MLKKLQFKVKVHRVETKLNCVQLFSLFFFQGLADAKKAFDAIVRGISYLRRDNLGEKPVLSSPY